MLVYGTRPEAIKMAPLIHALRQHPWLEPIVVVTGQHTTLLSQVHEVFGIVPDVNLHVGKPGISLDQVVAHTIESLGHLLDEHAPDAAVVHGDTSTTLAAGLAEFQHRVPVVHLEAGLRTGDLSSPFPEEGNRRVVGQLASVHLSPTAQARQALLSEGVSPASVHVIGNTAIDALDMVLQRDLALPAAVVEALAEDRPILTMTAHRRESWGAPLENVGRALANIARTHPDLLCVAPLHPNPLVRAAILPSVEGLSNVLVCDPLNYVEFAHLMAESAVLLSDSGGIQEEAPAVGVPLGVLRESTERPEVIESGQAVLLGSDPGRICSFVDAVLTDGGLREAMTGQSSPFGDGQAAIRSVQAIANMFDSEQPISEFSWDGERRQELVNRILQEDGVSR